MHSDLPPVAEFGRASGHILRDPESGHFEWFEAQCALTNLRLKAMARSAQTMQIIHKGLLVIVSGVTFLILCRYTVMFCETLSTLRGERMADEELLRLCAMGSASESPKMRSACMDARADVASPILIKTMTRTSSHAMSELVEIASKPLHTVSIATIFTVLTVIPWLGTLHRWINGRTSVHNEHRDDRHDCVVVLNGGLPMNGGYPSTKAYQRQLGHSTQSPPRGRSKGPLLSSAHLHED